MEPWQIGHHEQLANHEQRLKSLESRMRGAEEMQKSISDLTTSVAVMAGQMERVSSDTSEIKTELGKLNAVPGNRWETIIKGIITALIGAMITLALTKLNGG